MKTNYLKCCDCVEGMLGLPDDSIDLTVTSPPYDNARNYDGYVFDFENVAKQLYRITKQGGVVVWIVNDTTHNGTESLTSFKQALYFRSIGFNLHDTMIWIKDGGGAVGSQKCYYQNFEYMFVFSKGKPTHINLIEDKLNKSFDPTKDKDYGVVRKAGRRKKDGTIKHEFRRQPRQYSKRNNWWYCVPGRNQETQNHPAPFPEYICEGHIKSWSNENDVVFDPFMGSGTTAKMAILNNRKYIGFDCSQRYIDIAQERINNTIREMNK